MTPVDGFDDLDRAAGKVLVVGFGAATEGYDPKRPPPPLVELAGADALGGFILFKRNIGTGQQLCRLISELRNAFPRPSEALIGVDQEGGRVARLGPPVLGLPPMRTLGEWDDPTFTERLFFALGQQLHALGFNVDMAPVLDVDTNPDNPIIGDRSFGREPEVVIRHAAAVARGLTRAGVAACGKHFPGHGDTVLDSHLALPRLTHDRERLTRVELRPFKALAQTLPTMMTAHVVFDGLAQGLPATLSHDTMGGLLREELGFGGLVFSDDLEMKALSDHYSVQDAACGAIDAGCDALLICSEVERTRLARDALSARAHEDAGFAARLLEAADRVRALGQRFVGAAEPREATPQPELEAELAARLGTATVTV